MFLKRHFWESKSPSSLRDKSAAAGFICVPQQEHKTFGGKSNSYQLLSQKRTAAQRDSSQGQKQEREKHFQKEKGQV